MNDGPHGIMIVEDNVELCELYRKILVHKGYSILNCCENGLEARKVYESMSQYPSLVVMDYRMPYKDGLEASLEILELNSTQKILMISADLSVQKKLSGLETVKFLKKPFTITELLNEIELLIA
ncbi:MAG: response regulator [Candidatus Thorarchaeota archaeon]|jgi:DNA-binding response OmpR family regulator